MSVAPVLTPHSLRCDVVDEHAVCVLSSPSADVQLGVAPELGMLAFSIPATISSTTDGSLTWGNRPSTSGAVKATAMTISRFEKAGMAI